MFPFGEIVPKLEQRMETKAIQLFVEPSFSSHRHSYCHMVSISSIAETLSAFSVEDIHSFQMSRMELQPWVKLGWVPKSSYLSPNSYGTFFLWVVFIFVFHFLFPAFDFAFISRYVPLLPLFPIELPFYDKEKRNTFKKFSKTMIQPRSLIITYAMFHTHSHPISAKKGERGMSPFPLTFFKGKLSIPNF